MNIVVKAPHMDVTEAIKQYVDTKVAKLNRYYSNVHTIEVTLDVEGDKPSVEIIASAAHKSVFIGTQRGDDMYTCIDQALHKVQEQLRRHKDKIRDHRGPTHEETMELGGE